MFYTANKKIFGADEAKRLLQDAVHGVEVIIEELDKEITYNPERILGLKMSPGLLMQVATFIFGLFVAMVQYHRQKTEEQDSYLD